MNEEEKEAIEYLKTRLYGNEGCKYIDVAQEDLRIFINLVDRKEKDVEGWKKYCEEIEKKQTEMSNKNCELEFEVEKLQKEKEKLIYDRDFYFEHAVEMLDKILRNDYIPKQKLKDKMKELEWSLNSYDSTIASAGHSQAIGAYITLMDLVNEKVK